MRILVIRRDNIGDMVCTTPLLDGLRAEYPGAWIGVLANTYNADVLSGNKAVTAVYAYEKLKHRRLHSGRLVWDRLRLVFELRRLKIDWALVPSPDRQALAYARLIGPRNVGLGGRSADCHEVLRAWSSAEALQLRGTPGRLRVQPDPARLRELLRTFAPRPRVAVHLSARRPRQRWPERCFAELIRRISARCEVVVLWAPGPASHPRHPGDDERAARVVESANGSRVLPIPTADLGALVAALAICDMVVCPDGGAMHLAAGLGKPVVALFGDSPVERWRPWGVPHKILCPSSGDLLDLPVEPVYQAYLELMARVVS